MAEAAVYFLLERLAGRFEQDFQPLTDVAAEINSAMASLEFVKAFLRVADSHEDKNEELKNWVRQLRDAVYELEDVLDKYRLLNVNFHGGGYLSRSHRWINNFKARFRILPELKRMCQKITSICERHQMLKLDGAGQVSGSSGVGSSSWQDYRDDALLLDGADLVGIAKPKMHLMRWLLEGLHGTEIISIHGMGGLGKTTLVKQVYEDPQVKKHFELRVWISLSPSFSMEELLKDMFQQVSGECRRKPPRKQGNVTIQIMMQSIKNLLLNGRYLIVLDDVRNAGRWDDIKGIFPENEWGSHVMLTTRHVEIASAPGADFIGKLYSLPALSKNDSWELFCRKTFRGTSCPRQLEKICRAILEKCEGLPLSIVTIGRLLATKDRHRIDDWELISRSLRSEIEGNSRLKKINEVLSLSFYDLPYYLKFCFQLLSVFPEGHSIEHMRLVRLWVAEGFVTAREGRTPEEVAEDCFSEILSRSLIQVAETTTDGRVKMIRIHHLLRNMIITKSEEQSFAANADRQGDVRPNRLRRLSVHGGLKPSDVSRSLSQLRSLFMFGVDKKSIKAALSGVKLLEVLDLQDAPLKKFPIRVVDMHLLRYLSLRCTKVENIPSSIRNLQNLETLDLKHTNVVDLPVEIVELKLLRHLLVYRYETKSYEHTKYGFKTLAQIGTLHSLQKLCYIEADDERSAIIVEELGKLTQLRRLCILKLKEEDGKALCLSIMKMPDLRALSISSLEEDDIDLEHLSSPPPFLQRLYLTGHLAMLPAWIPSLCIYLITLHLRCSQLTDDPLPSLEELPSLMHLELHQVYDWKTLRFNARGFKLLKRLALDNFDLLSIEVEEGAMPLLETLIIQRCKCLSNVPSGIQHLTELKVLEFYDVDDQLVAKLQRDKASEEYRKVSHIPELRCGFCRDGEWDVEKVQRSGEEEATSCQEIFSEGELPRCWK